MADTLTDRPGGTTAGSNPAGRGGTDRPGTGSDSGAKARETLDEARQQAAGLASHARDQGKAILSQQKEGAAQQVESVADALHTTADELQRRNPQVGRFVGFAAERLEGFSRQMRDKDLDSLIEDTQRWGRQSPAAFFAGSMAVGFLLSRFLKSSTTPPAPRSSSSSSGRLRRQGAAHDWSWSSGSSGSTSTTGGSGLRSTSALTSPPITGASESTRGIGGATGATGDDAGLIGAGLTGSSERRSS